MRINSILVVLLAVLASKANGSPPTQSANRVIARSIDLAPVDGPPVQYGALGFSLGGPAITDRGDVWFTAGFRDLDGTWLIPDNGIFLHRDGQSRLVLRQDMPLSAPREGDPLWLMDPTDWGEQLATWHATDTKLYFTAPENYPPSRPFGIWSTAPNGSLSFQSIEDLLPIPFDNVVGATTRFTESGPAAIEVDFDDFNANGIFTRDSIGVFSLAAREDGPAAGTPDGWTFRRVETNDLAPNGSVLIRANVRPSEPVPISNGLWRRVPGGALELVALSGTTAPGTNRLIRSVGDGEINSRGDVVISAYLEGGLDPSFGEAGVWTDAGGGGLRKLVVAGDPAPGAPAGFVFAARTNPYTLIDESGKVVVRTHVEQGPKGLSGIWEESISGLQLVALSGNPAPGAGGKLFDWVQTPSINAEGQIVFMATLDEGEPGVQYDEVGIWAQDRQGELRLIIRTGDQVEVAPGSYRVVDDVSFPPSLNDQSVINGRGEIAFLATFTNGTQAIVVSDLVAIPEPSGWVLALGLVLLVAQRTRGNGGRRTPTDGDLATFF